MAAGEYCIAQSPAQKFHFHVPIIFQSRVAYKNLMSTLGGLLLRDANVSISEAEKQERLQQFVSDAFSVEMQLAKVRLVHSKFGHLETLT